MLPGHGCPEHPKGMTDRLIGARLGNYEVRELLGRGGMGAVYRGYDRTQQREVAIKVVGANGMLPDALARFRREARLARSLRHPNIVRVFGFDEADGTLFMVQELLPGPSLADQLRRMGRRRLAPASVYRIVSQLAAALDYAHERGVVHRDVKPGNALYNAAGELVLTDFGLARHADVQATATGPGVVMGTPGYVAPEQAVSSSGVTKACDIYALGVVLFELLTGRLPFEADTPMGVILKHLYDAPPAPSQLRPELPKALDAVVQRAMRKEPEQRFASAGALAAALAAAWPEARPNRAASPRPREAAVSASAATKPKPARTRTVAAAEAPAPRRARPRPDTPTKARPERVAAPRQSAREAPRPAPIPAPAPAPISARTGRIRRLRVGLLTACIVGALLLVGFGLDLTTISRGWESLLRLAGG